MGVGHHLGKVGAYGMRRPVPCTDDRQHRVILEIILTRQYLARLDLAQHGLDAKLPGRQAFVVSRFQQGERFLHRHVRYVCVVVEREVPVAEVRREGTDSLLDPLEHLLVVDEVGKFRLDLLREALAAEDDPVANQPLEIALLARKAAALRVPDQGELFT